MNQKSLDKKKTSELFEGVGSSLHQSFVEAVERDKEPKKISDCCSAEVVTANSGLAGETNYYICTKCHNDCDVITEPKELDRSFGEIQYGMNKINSKLLENSTLVKPKELDWEKEFDDEFFHFSGDDWNEACLLSLDDTRPMEECSCQIKDIKQFIKQTLTQQRTELLKLVNKAFEETVIESESCDYDFYEKLNNLLNKKDDTK